MLEIHDFEQGIEGGPAVWIDGGTHAPEFTGVMAALVSASRWIERIAAGDEELRQWFHDGRAFVMPCISPDGYQTMFEGSPFIRSTLRPPPPGTPRTGFEPCDMDGDNAVRWMRWKHPTGGFVPDEAFPLFMRRRTLDDDPEDAYVFVTEGHFLEYDGHTWVEASRRFGIDLNRNFPSSWAPFSMFGMDSGRYPGCEAESRAVLEAFTAYPYIGGALTNHTYTGCLLTQPYRPDTPFGDADLMRMEILAKHMVADTGYRVYRVLPEFTYDPKKPIVGVWADTISTVFGVPGYTMEYWDPYKDAGVEMENPASFFVRPDPEVIRKMLVHIADAYPDSVMPWKRFDHPQLGEVEIGGIEYLFTVRNPPAAKLAAECEIGYLASERLRKAIPRVQASTHVEALGADTWHVTLVIENHGYLPISGLELGAAKGLCPACSTRLVPGDGVSLVSGRATRVLPNLSGWGCAQAVSAKHTLYPSMGATSPRHAERWLVRGSGEVTLTWHAGRAGTGERVITLPETP